MLVVFGAAELATTAGANDTYAARSRVDVTEQAWLPAELVRLESRGGPRLAVECDGGGGTR